MRTVDDMAMRYGTSIKNNFFLTGNKVEVGGTGVMSQFWGAPHFFS